MAFLAPLFFLGVAALAVPVIIHMIQRERKEVLEFPSLMFIRKIPFHSFRRQRVRHWFLLLLRCAAVALLMAAFARPFFRAPAFTVIASGAREVVILLDRSYSMGYGDRWDRAKTAANEVVDALGPEDLATIIFFDSGAEAGPRSSLDRVSLRGLISDVELGSGTTRFGPALKLAEGVFEDSDLPQLEAVLVSDFQRSGVESAAGVRFPQGTILTPIAITDTVVENTGVTGVTFEREYFSGRERVVVAARVTNRSNQPVSDLAISLEIDEREVEAMTAELPANGSSTVSFSPVTLGDRPVVGAVRTGGDELPTDDVFYFVVSPGQVVTVLIVGNDRRASAGALYVSRALGIGSAPAFEVRTTTTSNFTAGDLAGRQVVIFNDTRPPTGQAATALERFVTEGGGLMVVAGERSAWPPDGPDLLPGTTGAAVDRTGRGGALGFIDYSHPVFELFGGVRSGDLSTARFFRYRPIEPGDSASVLARFDDGNPALVERRVGDGRVLFWASTIDNFWNDLALKPVFLPFVHRLAEHLADYEPPTPWYSAGQVLNLVEQRSLLADAGLVDASLVAVSPSGDRIPVSEGERSGFLTLVEQGLYEIRDASTTEDSPLTLAVNVDLSESDLTTIDPDELASSVAGRAAAGSTGAGGGGREFSSEDLERRQGVWWYLLIAAFLVFVAETIVSNRLSRTALEVG